MGARPWQAADQRKVFGNAAVRRGVQYSKGLVILCVVGLGATCGVTWLRQHYSSKWLEEKRSATSVENTLIRRITALSDFEKPRIQTLQKRLGVFMEQLGPADLSDRLVLQFGKDWETGLGHRENKARYSIQEMNLVRRSASVSDWLRILEVVKTIEHLPGARITSFEMRTSGSRQQRSVDVVKIVLVIYSRLPSVT